ARALARNGNHAGTRYRPKRFWNANTVPEGQRGCGPEGQQGNCWKIVVRRQRDPGSYLESDVAEPQAGKSWCLAVVTAAGADERYLLRPDVVEGVRIFNPDQVTI